MLKIALIGHDSRNSNLGVGALTVSEVELIRTLALQAGLEVFIEVFIGQMDLPSCLSGNDIRERVVRPMRRPLGFWRAVRKNDLVIDISGGDSFTDIYGRKRIFQIFLMKFLVWLAGKPIVMAPQTMGPFRTPFWRHLAALAVKRSALVATRDTMSTAFLREIGIKQDIIQASDIALRMTWEKQVKGSPAPKVGINVSGLLMAGGYSRNNMFGLTVDYPRLIRRIIESFLTHPDRCEVHLVGHVVDQSTQSIEDDYHTCLELSQEFPNVILAPPFATPIEAKSYISGLDFFLGSRMHACIAAFSTGVPVVPMAYSRKFSGLFGSLGYDQTVDCTSEAAEDILEKVFHAYSERDGIREEMKGPLELGRKRLKAYDQGLGRVLGTVAAGKNHSATAAK